MALQIGRTHGKFPVFFYKCNSGKKTVKEESPAQSSRYV